MPTGSLQSFLKISQITKYGLLVRLYRRQASEVTEPINHPGKAICSQGKYASFVGGAMEAG